MSNLDRCHIVDDPRLVSTEYGGFEGVSASGFIDSIDGIGVVGGAER